MSLLALLLALAFERGLTHLLHLREPRWLDRYYDVIHRRFGGARGSGPRIAATVAILLLALPVALASWLLGSHLLGIPQLAFAVLVLLVSFGPRDLRDEVADYIEALDRGDRAAAASCATELLEVDAAGRGTGLRDAVEDALFVQANNRIFGVIFWFVLIGPAGAWAFRVSDLMRRRAAFEASRHGIPPQVEVFGGAIADLHGLLAWLPARLAAVAYALAGSFEDAFGNWSVAVGEVNERLLDRTENLLARVGKGSLQPSLAGVPAGELDAATARGAWRIVARAVWIWLALVAVLVLVGSAT